MLLDDGLSEQAKTSLAAMIVLHEKWAGWQRERTHVLLFAASLVDQGVLTVGDVTRALGISQSSWYRHVKALRPVRGSELEADVLAAVDAALRVAGADESTTLADVKNDPNYELALATIGVHHRSTDTTGV
ncbi:MAG: hypothetical protein ACRD0W_23005 [Acidimicrobiales bacterium]